MILTKIKWAVRLLHSESYVVLTDTDSVINIPVTDEDKIEDIVLMKAQIMSLEEFSDRLLDLLRSYKDAERLLERRKKRE